MAGLAPPRPLPECPGASPLPGTGGRGREVGVAGDATEDEDYGDSGASRPASPGHEDGHLEDHGTRRQWTTLGGDTRTSASTRGHRLGTWGHWGPAGCALAQGPFLRGSRWAGTMGAWGLGSAGASLPSVEEQRQPEPVELIGTSGLEEGQQSTHLVQAVHLGRQMVVSPLGPADGRGPDIVGWDWTPAAGGRKAAHRAQGPATWEQSVAFSWK